MTLEEFVAAAKAQLPYPKHITGSLYQSEVVVIIDDGPFEVTHLEYVNHGTGNEVLRVHVKPRYA